MCDYLAKKRLFWDILYIPNIELSTLFKNNLPQRTRCINPQGFAQPKLEIINSPPEIVQTLHLLRTSSVFFG